MFHGFKPVRKKSKFYWSIFDLSTREIELAQLQKKSEDPNLWDDPQIAQMVMKNFADLRDEIQGWKHIRQRILDAIELAQMEDESLRPELESETVGLEHDVMQMEMGTFLSGPHDKGNAILAIHSGAGGTDSQDWAAMLYRLYLRWAERHEYQVEVIDLMEGEEAGIKNTTMIITGKYAYGYLRSEKGVHRLVRLSPFNSAHKRQTSFAMVEVLPEINEDDNITINPDELRIDVFRSSGAGGQNVQKNSTAIRLLHLPTGIIVTCQNERSQLQNRENAIRVLKARLLEIKKQEQGKQLSEMKGEFLKVEWGNQIRSYVLHPYQMVKDHRTDFEVGNTQAVLDGDIDAFIEAFLRAPKRE